MSVFHTILNVRAMDPTGRTISFNTKERNNILLTLLAGKRLEIWGSHWRLAGRAFLDLAYLPCAGTSVTRVLGP
jgi:hypothetical protein